MAAACAYATSQSRRKGAWAEAAALCTSRVASPRYGIGARDQWRGARMTRRWRVAGLSMASALCFTSVAWSQQPDHPLLLPKSDVEVVYQFDKVPMNGPHKLQITYTEAGQRVRLDLFQWAEAKVPYQSIIFDRPAGRLITLDHQTRSYTERPIGDDRNPGAFLSADVALKRQGTDTVAHAPCIVWRVEAPGKSNDQDTACVTDDGIALRLSSSTHGIASLIATSIHYASPPDDTFAPPKGYQRQPQS